MDPRNISTRPEQVFGRLCPVSGNSPKQTQPKNAGFGTKEEMQLQMALWASAEACAAEAAAASASLVPKPHLFGMET